MYSRLDSIFRTLPRQTEMTDTRQEIRREEKQDGRKREGDKESNASADAWEDSTVVSVRGLRAFLSGLLESGSGSGSGNGNDADGEEKKEQHLRQTSGRENTPAATPAALAARAYKTMYYAGQKEHQPPLPPPERQDTNPTLTPEEQRAIHKLIDDLAALSAHGVETLPIRKSESFLQSLVDATALALRS